MEQLGHVTMMDTFSDKVSMRISRNNKWMSPLHASQLQEVVPFPLLMLGCIGIALAINCKRLCPYLCIFKYLHCFADVCEYKLPDGCIDKRVTVFKKWFI